MIKSEKLNVYTIEQTKVALSNFDDKRYILNDGYTRLLHKTYKYKTSSAIFSSLFSRVFINFSYF